MRVDLDARVLTRDGEMAGTVRAAVLDPRTNEVTDFVVGTAGFLGQDVLVPRAEVEGATRDGESLRLGLTRDELSRLPVYVSDAYVPVPEGRIPPVDYAFPATGFLWPVAFPYAPPATFPAPGTAPDRRPGAPSGTERSGEPARAEATETEGDTVALGKGALVVDRDGDDLGVVDDVRFDPQTGALRGFVLRAGGTLRTLLGGGEHLEVSDSLVARVDEGVVHLKVPKATLAPLTR